MSFTSTNCLPMAFEAWHFENMQKPPNFIQLLTFSLILIVLLILVQVGVISIAMEKLGLSGHSIILILATSLAGSFINLPLFTIVNKSIHDKPPASSPRMLFGQRQTYTGKTVVAINVGGAIIPVFISLYLLNTYTMPIFNIGLSISIVGVVSYLFSRPIHKLGIGIPVFVAPFTAAIIAMLMEPTHTAPLAYISGTLGILIGADILRLNNIRTMATPVAAIGGAGTFDGVFLTGIFAVLLT